MSEPYAVAWAPTARRQLTMLPEKVGSAVVESVHALAENPHRVGHLLRHGLAGLRSVRRGDFRVLMSTDDDARITTIGIIEHRSDVYRRKGQRSVFRSQVRATWGASEPVATAMRRAVASFRDSSTRQIIELRTEPLCAFWPYAIATDGQTISM